MTKVTNENIEPGFVARLTSTERVVGSVMAALIVSSILGIFGMWNTLMSLDSSMEMATFERQRIITDIDLNNKEIELLDERIRALELENARRQGSED